MFASCHQEEIIQLNLPKLFSVISACRVYSELSRKMPQTQLKNAREKGNFSQTTLNCDRFLTNGMSDYDKWHVIIIVENDTSDEISVGVEKAIALARDFIWSEFKYDQYLFLHSDGLCRGNINTVSIQFISLLNILPTRDYNSCVRKEYQPVKLGGNTRVWKEYRLGQLGGNTRMWKEYRPGQLGGNTRV